MPCFVNGLLYLMAVLEAADNFSPEYIAINPNGTVPSLTSEVLASPITDSVEIVRYLDTLRQTNPLVPKTSIAKAKGQQIVDLVHSRQLDTNIILYSARDMLEFDAKKREHFAFFEARQQRLLAERVANPSQSFYGLKATENSFLYDKYKSPKGIQDTDFFANNYLLYQDFVVGLQRLDALLVLPYGAGAFVSEADFHVIPWVSHALVAAGADPAAIQDWTPLEKMIEKSVPGFKVGKRIKEWWNNVTSEEPFISVYPELR